MRQNVGKGDRLVRLALGVIFTVLALYTAGYLQIIAALVAVLGYVTGASGFCPLYYVMHASTKHSRTNAELSNS